MPLIGPWLCPMPRGCGCSTRKAAAASRSAIASKSAAPRPSEGNSTIGWPCPCASTSICTSPRVTIVRVTLDALLVCEQDLLGLRARLDDGLVYDPLPSPLHA